MVNVCEENTGVYVCITHKQVIPCDGGDQHLISNWKADVDKILETMENENG